MSAANIWTFLSNLICHPVHHSDEQVSSELILVAVLPLSSSVLPAAHLPTLFLLFSWTAIDLSLNYPNLLHILHIPTTCIKICLSRRHTKYSPTCPPDHISYSHPAIWKHLSTGQSLSQPLLDNHPSFFQLPPLRHPCQKNSILSIASFLPTATLA